MDVIFWWINEPSGMALRSNNKCCTTAVKAVWMPNDKMLRGEDMIYVWKQAGGSDCNLLAIYYSSCTWSNASKMYLSFLMRRKDMSSWKIPLNFIVHVYTACTRMCWIPELYPNYIVHACSYCEKWIPYKMYNVYCISWHECKTLKS